MKKIVTFLLIATLFPISIFAQWVSLNNEAPNTPPNVTILSDNENGTVIKVDISGFNISELNTNDKTYQSIDLLTEIFSTEAGFPEVPHIAKVLAVPDNASISVEVLETSSVQIFDNINLQPARLSWYEGEPESPYDEDSKAYQSSNLYPSVSASMEIPSIFRDFRIARLSIYPLKYIPSKNEVHVVSSITVRVNYGDGEAVNPKTTSKKAISPSFAKLYRGFIFNYKNVLDNLYNGAEEGRELMLCIMPDEFEASFQQYAEWKRKTGVDIVVTTFSDINANANDPNIIKDHIADAYHNWEYPPTYILIIGDNNIFPKKVVSYDYSFPNDDFFVEIDGEDFFPEMMIGRFTNQGDYRMRVMITKYLKYQQHPYTANTDWFKKGICCSNNLYASQVGTKRFTAEQMVIGGGFTVDTLMSDGENSTNCSMGKSDVLAAVNEGRSFLNYRGEGWNTGWWAQCYPLNVSDISNMGNGEKLTFVTSIGCGVAMFTAGAGNCFGEEWIQQGSLTEIRGGIAFVGPTSNTHTTYNNKNDKGIYVGMFQEGLYTPGEALLRGKLYMYNVFGNDPWVEYHYRVFTVLGDPSIRIWKDVPLNVTLSHPSTISIGYNQLNLSPIFTSNGQPAANARITLTNDDIFISGVTDSLGYLQLEVIPTIEDTLKITVTGGNVYPYQGEIIIQISDEHIGPSEDPVITDVDGNFDGVLNPGENIIASFVLQNWGIQIANNVQATISSNNPNVTIISTSPVIYGDMVPSIPASSDAMQFAISSNASVGDIIILQLHVTSNTSSWDYEYFLEVDGCRLDYITYLVNDENAANPNFHLDPDETSKIYFTVKNSGVDIATDIMGILYSNDPYVTVDDSTGSFGTLDIGEQETGLSNFYTITIDPACPTNYYAQLQLKLYTQNGTYSYEVMRDFSVPIGILSEMDFTGPDDYGYYVYTSTDSIYDLAPVYDWLEIEGVATEIFPGGSEYTETVTLPFTFKYYGIDYTELRISTDGWVAPGSGTQTAYDNKPLPNDDNVDNMIAGFWDDLHNQANEEGKMYYYSDTANHRFIIEWLGMAHYGDVLNPKEETFQIILYDGSVDTIGTGDGDIICQYKEIVAKSSISIGIENQLETIGINYCYNNVYDTTASIINDGLAIKFTTKLASLSLSNDEINAGGITNQNYYLKQNYPNPFSNYTSISYYIPKLTNVTLNIYDIRGVLIKTLHQGEQTEGQYSIEWNGVNNSGHKLSSGLYFYRLQTDDFTSTRKMFMLK